MAVRMDDAEHDDYGWFTFAEAYERIKWTDDREALEKVETRLSAVGSRLSAPTIVREVRVADDLSS